MAIVPGAEPGLPTPESTPASPPAPDTSAPETSAPGTSAPETSAPQQPPSPPQQPPLSPQFQQPPPPYGQPYQAPFPPPGYAPYRGAQPPRFNGWAIAGFVCSFFVHVLGLVFGLIALTEINRGGQRGRGLAIAGIAIGATAMVLAFAGGIAGWGSFREIIGPIGR